MAKKTWNMHADWLRLLETNLPVFNSAVLQKFYPQGCEVPSVDVSRQIRLDYERWRRLRRQHDLGRVKADLILLADNAWISSVIQKLLGWTDEESLQQASVRWSCFNEHSTENVSCLLHKGNCKLLFAHYQYSTTPTYLIKKPGCLLSPAEELIQKARDIEDAPRLALLTNGECWTLLAWLPDCPVVHATWYARDWRRESKLFNAFSTLFSFRCVCKPKNGLQVILQESLLAQENVADTMGEQVQRAIEVLVQSLDKADSSGKERFLDGITTGQLYEASLTVMMRLVFILCAEGRRLLPFGEAFYDENYAISTLRTSLQEEADVIGEEVLENRFDAWLRFLALCRLIYQGCEHEDMRMPALGGSLFDPNRYPFLDGGVNGQHTLPVDNRTVLYLLDALQVVDSPSGAEYVSYGAVDVEQIGHIYEGLLELEIRRTDIDVVRLQATKNATKIDWSLAELESLWLDGQESFIKAVSDKKNGSGIAGTRLKKLLEQEVDETLRQGLLMACGGNVELAERIAPFANLLRLDAWKRPIVYQKNSYTVTHSASRRDSGSYYTPRLLTESIVKTTLDPLIYHGMAEGKPEEEWITATADEILSLKICDLAMGSGAFLVQVCRYLSEHLVRAWALAESEGKHIKTDGSVVDALGDGDPMSDKPDDRVSEAKRLIAERCLYGVDKNPMAVELAKLSIWLVTLSKGRPFGFLDHCLGCGDSLLGITNIKDIFAIGRAASLFGSHIETAVREASEARRAIETSVILDIQDVQRQQEALIQIGSKMEPVELLADVLLLEILNDSGKKSSSKAQIAGFLSMAMFGAFQRDPEVLRNLYGRRAELWGKLQGQSVSTFKPFHYCLRFPEVFENGGFDAVVGNPPFIGNKYWKTNIGSIVDRLANEILGVTHGKIDISVVFHRRAFELLRAGGFYGLLGVTNISESGAVKVGLEEITKHGAIYSAVKSMKWPGDANINVAIVHVCKQTWKGELRLNGVGTDKIYPNLTNETFGEPKKIATHICATQGLDSTYIDFLYVDPESNLAKKILEQSQTILVPIVNGQIITNTSLKKFDYYVIYAGDKSLEEIRRESEAAYQFLISIRKQRLGKIREKSGSYKGWEERWWQHWNTRAEFFNQHPQRDRLIYPVLTKYPIPRHVCGILATNQAVIIPVVFEDLHALTLSSAMQHWLATFTGAKKGADAVQISIVLSSLRNFPCPKKSLPEATKDWAREFDSYLRDQGGITPAMNRFHNASDKAAKVERVRELQRLIDKAVIGAYGWTDLELSYEFSDQGLGGRYGLKEATRKELLRRLVRLNNEYWEEQNPKTAKEKQ